MGVAKHLVRVTHELSIHVNISTFNRETNDEHVHNAYMCVCTCIVKNIWDARVRQCVIAGASAPGVDG